MQREFGHQDFEVDLQAQLTFSARYWSVFFVQDGEIPAMVHCTDAVSAILCDQPFGKWLRLRGLVYRGQPDISLVGVELLEGVTPVEPLELKRLPAADSLPIDRVVKLRGRLLEAFDRFSHTVLFAQVDDKVVELQVQSHLSPKQYQAIEAGADAAVYGTISPKYDWKHVADSSIRMIGIEQLLVSDEHLPHQSTTPMKQVAGHVLFTDHIDHIVVGGDQGNWRVATRFAEQVKPGTYLVVWGEVGSPDSNTLIAHRLHEEREEELKPGVPLDAGDWERSDRLPARVVLEAIVVEQTAKDGLRHYHLRSASCHFTAVVKELSGPRELFRAGDRIRLTGAPLIDSTFERNDPNRFKLYVVAPEDTEFVSAPVQLSMTHLAWAASIGCLLVGFVFSWNWLLHRQVNERTRGLKKLSSHLQMSFDAISEAILVTDADHRLSAWNRQFERLFGQSPNQNCSIDQALGIICKRLVDQAMMQPILQASETRVAVPVGATLSLENPTQVVRAFVASIIDSEGTYHGQLVTFEDITEKQRLEDELIQSQKMEAIGQLSGGIAHDFNNLLTVVSSNLALIKLLDSKVDPEYVNAAETAVRRAAELTQQLLDFSRRSKLEIQVVNLNELVERIGVLLSRTFDRSIRLQTELCSIPLHACLDVNRIEQVLINICINARDAIKGRSGAIIMRVSKASDDGGDAFACIEIEDNGCGMPRDVLARIFDPFFTTKKPGEGTGLGLSMAQGVVEQLGGRISCDSKLDIGTCFRILLPLAKSSAARAAIPPLPSLGGGRHLRILLVDDEAMVRSASQALLRGLGHQPIVACSGQEALSILESTPCDVVLLDLTMPSMSGKETYVQIHQRWPDLPVAICTGYHVDLQTWNQDCDIAAPKIIAKPYSVETLSDYLQSLHRRPVHDLNTNS